MSDNWPGTVVVRLRFAEGKPFTALEGAVAILETTGKNTDEPRKYLKVQKPKPGGFEATIPATQMRVLYLHWVDRYRH